MTNIALLMVGGIKSESVKQDWARAALCVSVDSSGSPLSLVTALSGAVPSREAALRRGSHGAAR